MRQESYEVTVKRSYVTPKKPADVNRRSGFRKLAFVLA